MPIIRLPDGTLVRFPDPPASAPEVADFVPDSGPAAQTAKAMGATALTGIGEAGVGMLNTALKFSPLAAFSSNAMGKPTMPGMEGVFEKAVSPKLMKGLHGWERKHSDITGFPQVALKGLAGGALLGPGGAVTRGAGAVAGATGATAGEATSRFLPESEFPTVGPTAAAIAALLAGGGTGALLGPRQSVARRDIRLELENRPDADWDAAARTIRDFQQSGARTATLAEAFPGQTGIKALAAKAAGSRGGEELRTQLENRGPDLQRLGETFMDRIGSEVSPARVANTVSESANSYLQGQKDARGTRLANTLQGQSITQAEAQMLYDNLIAAANMQRRPSMQAAYREVAQRLLSTARNLKGEPIPLTLVQDLSLEIKSLKEASRNPLSINGGAQQIAGGNLREPISIAERGLEAFSPSFETGMRDFRNDSQRLREIFEGPIGRLSDRNPMNPVATPAGRLNAVTGENTPGDIRATMRTLTNPMEAFPTVSPVDIARALAQQKLGKGQENPGKLLRGNPGSAAEGQFNALLESGGLLPERVNQPLRAADAMTLGNGLTIAEMPQMRAGQLALRPFRTLDMLMTAKTEKDIQREISRLLMNATPEGLNELRMIAEFRPDIRKILAGMSGAAAMNVTQQKE